MGLSLGRSSYKVSIAIAIAAFSVIVIVGLILVLQSADTSGELIIFCLLPIFSAIAALISSLGTPDSIIDLEEDEI
jgi:hypothetical protein